MKKCFILLALMATIFFPITSWAIPGAIADWDFINDDSYFPGKVVMRARLVNTGTSANGNFTRYNFFGGSGSAYPSPAGTYFPLSFGPSGRLWDQFNDINLRPGESFDFIFGTYTPSPPTPKGDYSAASNTIIFKKYSNEHYTISRDFSWKAGFPPVEPNIVPEPTTLLLFGAGLLGAGFFRRKRTKK